MTLLLQNPEKEQFVNFQNEAKPEKQLFLKGKEGGELFGIQIV